MSPKSNMPQPESPHDCPVCGDRKALSVLCETAGFAIYKCATCRAEHAHPTPSHAELKAYYDRAEWFEGGEPGGYQNYDRQTESAAHMMHSILEPFPKRDGLMVLDMGCGYGTHLKFAAERGWTCFGVELSDHARKTAQERLGAAGTIVESISDLFSHPFDLVLMLDFIEHLPSPYQTLYELFSIGVITPQTRVVIATPNAGSDDARKDPAGWIYRHPPSHLVYYNVDALTFLLRRLHFTTIEVLGLGGANEKDLSGSAGLMVTASGSDFMSFMHERYVPGTWSKLAAYEHLPRYALAKTLAKGKTTLDFGCGTGYGTALLAQSAKKATGLDIDEPALIWARDVHRAKNIDFLQSSDLGAALASASYDLITCFEMIEHVDFKTQQAVIANVARLLRPDGLFLISTPNPEVTKLYDANPYHIREMTETEFRDLLAPQFPHIQILRQHLLPGIAFNSAQSMSASVAAHDLYGVDERPFGAPLAYVAICGQQPIPQHAAKVFFDTESDYTQEFVSRERKLNLARFDAFKNDKKAAELGTQVGTLQSYLDSIAADRDAVRTDLSARIDMLQGHLNAIAADRDALRTDLSARIDTLQVYLDAISADREAVRADLSARIDMLQAHSDALAADREAVRGHRDALQSETNRLQTEMARLDGEFGVLKTHYVALEKMREAELASPRFLARRLWQATRARLRSKISGQRPGIK